LGNPYLTQRTNKRKKMMSSEKIFAILLAFSGLQVCRGAAIGDIARNVRSELVRLDAGLNPQSRRSRGLSLDVPAGGAVDMFYRYGFFSLSVRVVPRDDPGKWLIREPTADIFDSQSIVISETAGPDTFARQPFQISLCEDLDELLSAYFRDFKADGVEQPHKLFTGSWRLPTAAQYLGLGPQALDDSVNSYVLVKLVRNKGTKAASGNIRLNSEAAAEANKVQSQNNDAILKVGRDYQDEANEDEDDSDQEGKVALDNKLSDLEYLKSKGFTDGHKGDKKVFFTVKLEGLPFNAKKKDVKKFIGSNMGVKSIRVPRHIKGIAYVGFATEKERQVVMKKDKSFMGTKQILVRQYDVDQKQAEMKSKVGKWKLQEDGLKDLDETIGQSGRLFIRNLSYAVSEDDLEGLFKPFGPLAEINVPSPFKTTSVGIPPTLYFVPNSLITFTSCSRAHQSP